MSSSRQLFGTDGIRGRANVFPMTAEVALRVGMAVAAHFGRHGRVVVGKDTRISGYMFETALASGLCSLGVDVMLVGPLPTPGIAYITQSMRADAGVVISASHNPFADNGIKLFARDGFKLPDHVEAHLEGLMEPGVMDGMLAEAENIGKAVRIDDAAGRYITHVKQAFPAELVLDGFKIVVDCAHGAAYKIAPKVLRELGAEVITLAETPDGTNINAGVGALHPETMSAAVRAHGADLGLALDGDADRVLFSDAAGNIVDGDQVLAICGIDRASRESLPGRTVVATVMSNLGLERCLLGAGLRLLRTPVGDRYVVEAMLQAGARLGGEQSGHIISLDHATTGDGVVAALQILSVMVRSGRSLADLAGVMLRFPQVQRSFETARRVPVADLPRLSKIVQEIERDLGSEGRVLVRWSGTEAKLRVMIEGQDLAHIDELVGRIAEVALAELGTPGAA